MSQLYLIGTNHWDLKGPQRLRKLLGYVRPSAIGLEASENLINLRLKDRELIKAQIEEQKTIEKLFETIGHKKLVEENQLILDFIATQGYEIWTSYEFKKEESPATSIYPIHENIILEKTSQEHYKEKLGKENMNGEGMFTKSFFEKINKLGHKTFQIWMDSSYSKNDYKTPEEKKFVQNLDDIMEPKIRSMITKHASEQTAIVCGSSHFYGKYDNNLYERLKDLSPVRVLLTEVDNFK